MKSPFPGMDPYLEPYWTDVHARLTTYTSDALQRRLEQCRQRLLRQRRVAQAQSLDVIVIPHQPHDLALNHLLARGLLPPGDGRVATVIDGAHNLHLLDEVAAAQHQGDFILDGTELLIACRRLLKNNYVYAYNLEQGTAEKELFEWLQADLEVGVEALGEMLQGPSGRLVARGLRGKDRGSATTALHCTGPALLAPGCTNNWKARQLLNKATAAESPARGWELSAA